MKKQDNKEEVHHEIEEWKGKYLRALADYQNLERRVNQERQELRERVVEEIMHSVLLLLDEIQRAQKYLKDSGLDHAMKSFDATLAYYKIKKIDVLGKEFNPHELECIEVVEDKTNKETEVVEEIRPGFYIGNKVLRVAQVKVAKSKNYVSNTPFPGAEN